METVKERKPPVRPHWMGMYKEADEERKRLKIRVAELESMEGQCHSMENEIQELQEEAETKKIDTLKDKNKVALEEINFLRGIISEITAASKQKAKAQG